MRGVQIDAPDPQNFWRGDCVSNVNYYGPGCTSNGGHVVRISAMVSKRAYGFPVRCTKCAKNLWGMHTIEEDPV